MHTMASSPPLAGRSTGSLVSPISSVYASFQGPGGAVGGGETPKVANGPQMEVSEINGSEGALEDILPIMQLQDDLTIKQMFCG